jgi:hypothetical protein
MIAMPNPIKALGRSRIALTTTILILIVLAPYAISQLSGPRPAARHFEYVHQEILASALTQSLNDLDGQGWEVFQVVPSWQIKNENAETVLAPRAYEVFGRRAVNPK